MANKKIIGIDCGATKIMAQSCIYSDESQLIYPSKFHFELKYEQYPGWDSNFKPISLSQQQHEYSNSKIKLSNSEIKQGLVIINAIKKIISLSRSKRIGLCFPGIKNQFGIVVMANGPRIPNLYSQIPEIDTAYNDSECCVLGEWKSNIGKITNEKNIIYIGGGTGIADGIILKNKLLDFNSRKELKRSWELMMDNGESIESNLSPQNMINNWNYKTNQKLKYLDELISLDNNSKIIDKAVNAFKILIDDRINFFKNNNAEVDAIIIGQRLGQILNENNSIFKQKLNSQTNIPIKYSSDRRLAALGAGWKKACL